MDQSAGPEVNSPCIVIADDERIMREIIRAILEGEGCEVIEAETAAKAVTAIEDRQGDVDLFVADVMMPDMTGPEAAAQIRERYQGISILFLTGYAPDVVPEEMLAAPQVEVLEKPFETDQLIRTVQKLLNSPSAGRNAT